jgi:hypothetical protein
LNIVFEHHELLCTIAGPYIPIWEEKNMHIQGLEKGADELHLTQTGASICRISSHRESGHMVQELVL